MFQKGKVTSEDKQKLFLFVLFRKGSEAMLKVFFSFGGGGVGTLRVQFSQPSQQLILTGES